MDRVLFTVPTHSNLISTDTAVTMLDFQKLAHNERIPVSTYFSSASIISHLRNTIVADFLASDNNVLIMMDSDQGIHPAALIKMIKTQFPVVGCLYPRRNFFWTDQTKELSTQEIDKVLLSGYRFVGSLEKPATGKLEIKGGYARAKTLGTGIMVIRREAIEKMISHYPELKNQGFPVEDENVRRAPNNWGFFNPMVEAFDGENAGEDIGFCKRWTKCGGELWADVVSSNVHIGRYKYKGSFVEYLKAMGAITP